MARKFVIISSNGAPEYEWYLPIVKWAWNQIGWEVVCLRPFKSDVYLEATITQCIRLYAACLEMFEPDDMLMTSDADMIPLSDYWHPDPKEITSYGHDLTNFQHNPMCYIAMTAARWREVMCLKDGMEATLLRDLALTNALDKNKELVWVVDQDIITGVLSQYKVWKVNRGIEPGSHLPLGRMDRAGMKLPSTLIDFHGPREPWNHIEKIREVIIKAFGKCPSLLLTGQNEINIFAN